MLLGCAAIWMGFLIASNDVWPPWKDDDPAAATPGVGKDMGGGVVTAVDAADRADQDRVAAQPEGRQVDGRGDGQPRLQERRRRDRGGAGAGDRRLPHPVRQGRRRREEARDPGPVQDGGHGHLDRAGGRRPGLRDRHRRHHRLGRQQDHRLQEAGQPLPGPGRAWSWWTASG
ncbi:hypothetical protein G5V59_05395 [Nocardioides sp. W3-2-3]|uniref:hypothetical protein n=1 Tax=Nocardioides convexus TaxID=2712224 RepID=UPI0024181E37|nr:hypothetical protein [Nocardioides convexus]NGZ99878.1 hypothetical protein [Nocardioides convexus]